MSVSKKDALDKALQLLKAKQPKGTTSELSAATKLTDAVGKGSAGEKALKDVIDQLSKEFDVTFLTQREPNATIDDLANYIVENS